MPAKFEERLRSIRRVQLYIWAQSVLDRTPPKLKNWVRTTYLFRTLVPLLFDFDRSFDSRQYLKKIIFPALAASHLQRVLFVGCKAYTARYGRQLTRAGIDYWTTDIEPAAAVWGEKDHHIVCDIAEIDKACPAESFDAILLNGVLGDGVDEESDINRAIKAIARILRPDGALLIGWNSDKKEYPDPMSLEAISMYFRHECVLPLPVTKTFPGSPHIYNWLTKTRAAEANPLTQEVFDDLVKIKPDLPVPPPFTH